MTTVHAAAVVPGPPAEAEALWFDSSRWPTFVDTFGHVARIDESWPEAGAILAWDSTPHGRGRVLERVVAREAGARHEVTTEDERLEGTQTITFAPEGENTRVTLELDYRLKQRTPFTPVVDLLFVRRAVTDSLRRTLRRLAIELT